MLNRRSFLTGLATALGATLPLIATAEAQPYGPPGRHGPPPPPPPRREGPRGRPPRPDALWQPGHWVWRRGHYDWVPGHWVSHRQGAWREGRWEERRGRRVWVKPGWR